MVVAADGELRQPGRRKARAQLGDDAGEHQVELAAIAVAHARSRPGRRTRRTPAASCLPTLRNSRLAMSKALLMTNENRSAPLERCLDLHAGDLEVQVEHQLWPGDHDVERRCVEVRCAPFRSGGCSSAMAITSAAAARSPGPAGAAAGCRGRWRRRCRATRPRRRTRWRRSGRADRPRR